MTTEVSLGPKSQGMDLLQRAEDERATEDAICRFFAGRQWPSDGTVVRQLKEKRTRGGGVGPASVADSSQTRE